MPHETAPTSCPLWTVHPTAPRSPRVTYGRRRGIREQDHERARLPVIPPVGMLMGVARDGKGL